MFYLISFIIVLIAYVAQKVFNFWRATRSINNYPGFRTLFSGRFIFLRPKIRGITTGANSSFYSKHDEFAKAGVDVLSGVESFPSTSITYYVADPAVIKEVTGARARFPKPVDEYRVLSTFGQNILITEGDAWKHQRKIVAPAFSEKNNRLVWDETARTVGDLFASWGARESVTVDHVLDITIPVTLLVIGSAGFGRKISWDESTVAPPGHTITFKEALDVVSHRLHYKVLVPDWLLRWGTPAMRRFHQAYSELEEYMRDMVHARRTAEQKEERYDLFSSLLDANDAELSEASRLSDSALMGNIFIFLVAGYETTAHTIAYALILLALYQDEQEAFYQNIRSVLPTDRAPTYDDFGSLSYSMAVLNETLRLYPPVIEIPKKSAEDTTLGFSNAAGEKTVVPVLKDAYILICTPALHHNPRYWEDPATFKPSRFLKDYTREAFLPFSGGPRACIGRGFAETEAVAALTLILSRYKVEIREEPQFASETFAQRKARVLKSRMGLTVYPERAPLVFRRRL